MTTQATDHTSLISEQTTTFFEHLGLPVEIQVTAQEDSEYYQIQINTEQPGLLIGYRGETMTAIQGTLSHLIKAQAGDWVKIIVNVGDYRQQREQTLLHLAENAARRVQFSGEPYIFTNLTPPERRVIHMTLKEHANVTTESRGEGRNRQLVVLPR